MTLKLKRFDVVKMKDAVKKEIKKTLQKVIQRVKTLQKTRQIKNNLVMLITYM